MAGGSMKLTEKAQGAATIDSYVLVTQMELPSDYVITGNEEEGELDAMKIESVRRIPTSEIVELVQDNLEIDDEPTDESDALITSGSVKAELDRIDDALDSYNEDITNLETNKQDVLTFDSAPTAESTNPVTSAGIKTALDSVDTEIGELKENLSEKTQSLWEVIKCIGAFTDANGLTAVNAFKEAWGAYDVIDINNVTVTGIVDFFEVGETRQLTASISPTVTAPDQYEEHTLVFSSSNTSVATVDSTGLVTAISAGNATITATVTADSGIYTASIDITVIADQIPLYTLPQGTGLYSDNKTSMTIDGNRVSFSMNNIWTTTAKLRIERLPDGTYSCSTPAANPNMLFSLEQGDLVTVKLYNIVFPDDLHNKAFIFDLIGSDNKNIHGAGRNIIYRTTRPDGMIISTKTISAAKDIYGISNEVALNVTNGTYAFNFKMFVNGIRYY